MWSWSDSCWFILSASPFPLKCLLTYNIHTYYAHGENEENNLCSCLQLTYYLNLYAPHGATSSHKTIRYDIAFYGLQPFYKKGENVFVSKLFKLGIEVYYTELKYILSYIKLR